MIDHVDTTKRSQIMASVGSKNTQPEMIVRRYLHRLGYRYSLHRRDLPGSPDLAFPRLKKVVFVNGCFWHGHRCRFGGLPKSNEDYWKAKIEANRARDSRNIEDLCELGWKVHVVWECELRDRDDTFKKVTDFLDLA